MLSYKIRIDSHDRTNIKLLLSKYSDRYMLAFEGQSSENPHCHGFFATTTKPATIRSNLRKQFGTGNGSYSMKELDEDYPLEYIAYIIKEGDYIEHNMPPEILVKAKEHDTQVKLELKAKKEKKKTVLAQIDEKYFSDAVNGILDDNFITKEYVVDKVLEYYRESKGLIREFMIVSICQTLCLKHVRSYERYFKNRILEKLA